MELFVRNTTIFFKSLFFFLWSSCSWKMIQTWVQAREYSLYRQETGDRWRAVSNFYSLRWTILYLVISKGSECIHPEISSFMLWKNERCWPETDLIGYGITIHWLWNCNNDNKSYYFLIACCVRGMRAHGWAYAKLTTALWGRYYRVPNL